MPRGNIITAERIDGMLREAEVELTRGKTVPEAVQKPGVTKQTYRRWRRWHRALPTDRPPPALPRPPSFPA